MSDQGEHPDGPDLVRDWVWSKAVHALGQAPEALQKPLVERDKDAEMTDQVDRDLMLMALGEVLSIFHLTPVDDSQLYQALADASTLKQWKMAMTSSLERPRCEFRGQKLDEEVVRCVRAEHSDCRHLMAWG